GLFTYLGPASVQQPAKLGPVHTQRLFGHRVPPCVGPWGPTVGEGVGEVGQRRRGWWVSPRGRLVDPCRQVAEAIKGRCRATVVRPAPCARFVPVRGRQSPNDGHRAHGGGGMAARGHEDRDVRVLVVGWFSFLDGEATAGDVEAAETVCTELDAAGITHETAWSPNFRPEGLDLDEAEERDYSDLVFVCGPLSGPQVQD